MTHPASNGFDIAVYFSKLLPKSGTTPNRRYEADREYFDLLFSFKEKYGLDVEDYLHHYVKHVKAADKDVPISEAVDSTSIGRYLEWRAVLGSYDKALERFDKSVEKVADACISTNPIQTPKEYMDNLVSQDILGEMVISGRISLYYLAGIRNFGTTLKTLRQTVSNQTIGYFVENFDIYENYIKSAFIEIRGIQCDSFLLTEKKIREKLFRS